MSNAWVLVFAAWGSILAVLLVVLGAVWKGGRALQRIEDCLTDFERRLKALEEWRERLTSVTGKRW